jgi:general secretion pathway protein D
MASTRRVAPGQAIASREPCPVWAVPATRWRAIALALAVGSTVTCCIGAEDLPAPSPPPAADAEAAKRVIAEALSRGTTGPGSPAQPAPPAGVSNSLLLARVSAEVAAKQLEAKRLAQKSPADAFALLDATATTLGTTDIPADKREQLLRRIERTRRDIEESTGKRRAEIALDQRNAEVESQVDRERAKRVEVDQRIAMLVEEYNSLIDQQRFAEAEAIAKKAGQLSPDNVVVRQLLSQSRVIRRMDTQRTIEGGRQDAFLNVAEDVQQSATPFTGPIEFPGTKQWGDLTKNRSRLQAEGRSRATPAELEIHRKLETKVKAPYKDQPLSEVLADLQKQAGVPIHLDMVGLEQEAITSDTRVTLSLEDAISLKSVLKLLLEPLHLGFVVKDEVLKVTSPRLVKGEVYSVSYPVADLVLPIPNFSSDGLGIEGALSKGYSQALRNSLQVQVGPAPRGLNQARAEADAAVDAASLAQIQARGNGPVTGAAPSIPFGPPSVGGGQADFQSLIELIQNTVQPPTWDTQGGPGAIRPFDTNLSIVVSQTQEVHEEIADLLEQLRRLQDLQVTIEVRFITLNDTFFERIGVDFDFNIQSGVNAPLNMTAVPTTSNGSNYPGQYPGITAQPGGRSQLIGLDNSGNPGVALGSTATGTSSQQLRPSFFSVPFRQSSFNAARVPQLPGLPDPTASAATFGFAILSDIEAYFLIEAAQGNTRTNIMQAPKVTLFNGQNAFVSDTRQRPFVTAVIPVVGDFSAAQQPVITVLNEGTAVNVQAVVSNDRRFVRLTLVPFFSQIGKVEQFQFEGSRSTKSKSSDEKSGADVRVPGVNNVAGLTAGSATSGELEVQSNGTTIQLPEFLFTTVTTTVSVPDGGTVLLGGIKRLREGRNEFGVPILSKVPYINRLFKNVGLGRTTDSLMLMVTPRIIIQEEEEDKLLGTNRP